MDSSNSGGRIRQPWIRIGGTSARRSGCDSDNGPISGPSETIAHGLLLIIAIGVAWLPLESHSWTAVIVSATVLALCQWGWQRTGQESFLRLIVGALVVLLVLTSSAAAGWDIPRAVGQIGLVAVVAVLAWFGSRSRPPELFPALLAVGLAALAFWGLWQTFIGLETLRPGLDGLAIPARAYAEERLASRRAFASLPLPSHLAVLLATALPLLLVRVRATPRGAIWIGFAVLATAGLVATRSPVGIGLAVVVVIPILVTRDRSMMPLVVGGFIAAMVVVIAIRPDVAALERVSLRLDNWRTGVWLWTTSPVSGVGVGSFAQASQANPLLVGNRPAHAHSLPAEGLAELGPVGLVAVILFGVWLLRLIRFLWRDQRALAVAIAVVPLHNLVDFSFFVSGVALPWGVLVGWAAAHRNSGVEQGASASSHGRIFLITAAAIALGVVTFHATSVVVEEIAACSPNASERFDGAYQALRLAPWRIEPQFLLATAAISSGNRVLQDRAWFELDRRRWLRPRSAALAERRARLALVRGDVSAALAELWVAAEYGVPNAESTFVFDELVENLESVNRDSVR